MVAAAAAAAAKRHLCGEGEELADEGAGGGPLVRVHQLLQRLAVGLHFAESANRDAREMAAAYRRRYFKVGSGDLESKIAKSRAELAMCATT